MKPANRQHVLVNADSVWNQSIQGMGITWRLAQPEAGVFSARKWDVVRDRLDGMGLGLIRIVVPQDLWRFSAGDAREWLKPLLLYGASRECCLALNLETDATAEPEAVANAAAEFEASLCRKGAGPIGSVSLDPGMAARPTGFPWTRRACEALRHALDAGIAVRAPGQSPGGQDFAMMVAGLNGILGSYSLQSVPEDCLDIINDQLEKSLRQARAFVTRNDPAGGSRRIWLEGLGCADGDWDKALASQNLVDDFPYGLWITDAAVQSFRAGMDAVFLWEAEDIPVGKAWRKRGLWAPDGSLRPWFYPLALLGRLLPRGMAVLDTGAPNPEGVKALAAVRGGELTLVIVNALDRPVEVRVQMPRVTGSRKLTQYDFFTDNRTTGENGLPRPSREHNAASLGQGLELSFRGEGAVFLSTLPHSACAKAMV